MEQENHYIMNLMSLKRNNNLFKKYKIAIFVTQYFGKFLPKD
ncbi:hypothetical protein BACCOP_00279 [Phocaeicola coprocola DSM 17136]|uniref:Uncharacterized protein n=1 Tax=Phocaeicola coprocola DSM 17136 TaxID=470145 RepID=B3JEI7_9BACT|nr:hypothetical protein BACCOP_00279 [Phocaeicola coprocola DSM 17136]